AALANHQEQGVRRRVSEVYVSMLPLRREAVPGAKTEQLRRTRGFLRHTRQIRGDRVRDVRSPAVFQRPTEYPPRPIDEEQAFIGPLKTSEHSRFIKSAGRGCRGRR